MNQRKPVAWRDPTNPTMICKDEHQLSLAEPVYAQMSHVAEPQSTEAIHGNNAVYRNGLCDVLRRHPRSGGGREDLEKLMAESQPRDGEGHNLPSRQQIDIWHDLAMRGDKSAITKLHDACARAFFALSEKGPTYKPVHCVKEGDILVRFGLFSEAESYCEMGFERGRELVTLYEKE